MEEKVKSKQGLAIFSLLFGTIGLNALLFGISFIGMLIVICLYLGMFILCILGICLLIITIILIGGGISKLFIRPMGGIALLSFAVALAGVGLFLIALSLWFYTVFTPFIYHKVFRYSIRKEKESGYVEKN